MLSAILPTSRRLRRSAKAARKSHRNTKITAGVERLEDRTLLTAAAFFYGLGDLPGGNVTSQAWGISDDGQTVVGVSGASTGYQAVRWTLETEGQPPIMEPLGLLSGGTESMGYATSDDGSVIVGYSDGTSSSSFRWTEMGMEEIPLGSGNAPSYRGASDVSSNGNVIVGELQSINGREAYIWTDGAVPEIEALGDLAGGDFESRAWGVSDNSVVVGWGTNADNRRQAFIWNEQGMGPLIDSDSHIESGAFAISDDGSVVVGYDVISETTERFRGKDRIVTNSEAFRWTENGMEHLGDLDGGAHFSKANAVSADGSVVGGVAESDNGTDAFIWDDANGIRSLQDVLVSDYGLGNELKRWQLLSVWGISADGMTFSGEALNPDGKYEAFIAGITPPQPGITVVPSSGIQTSEDGTSDVINVVLAAKPTDVVMINVSSSDVTEGEIAGPTSGVLTLTFNDTNWNMPQQVTIQGVEDSGELDGDQPYSIELDPSASADPDYATLTIVEISATNLDNDAPAPSNTIYVYDIVDTFDTRQRGRHNTDHRIMIDVRQDDNGLAEASDIGIGGVQVTVELRDSGGSLVGTYTGTTDSDGLFYSSWIKNLSPGDYRAEVTDLVLAGNDWDLLGLDPTFLDEDDDGDGKPDQLLSV